MRLHILNNMLMNCMSYHKTTKDIYCFDAGLLINVFNELMNIVERWVKRWSYNALEFIVFFFQLKDIGKHFCHYCLNWKMLLRSYLPDISGIRIVTYHPGISVSDKWFSNLRQAIFRGKEETFFIYDTRTWFRIVS